MKTYDIKFFIGKKALRMKIEANSEEMAKRILAHKIKIHEIKEVSECVDFKEEVFSQFKNIFNSK